MKKRIITFTMSLLQSQFEVNRLVEEAERLGVGVKKALYREIEFEIGGGRCRVLVAGEEINGDNTLGCWFRVAGTKSGKYVEGRNLLIRLLRDEVVCINGKSYLGWPRMGKISQHGVFEGAGIEVVPTRIFYQKEVVRNFLIGQVGLDKKWEFPLVVKHERGYQGKSVRKLSNLKEALGWLEKINEKNLGMFLWQRYLPLGWDLRVIVIGGRAVGAMKRTAVGKEFRSNFSLGGKVEGWELSDVEKGLAETVAEAGGLDYAGVDIMKDERGNNYVLEVNRQCQFRGFEQATGINVAREVVSMLLQKEKVC